MSQEYQRKWYEENKEYRKEYMKGKVVCECGTTVSRASMFLHKRSKKHERLMDSISKKNTTHCTGCKCCKTDDE